MSTGIQTNVDIPTLSFTHPSPPQKRSPKLSVTQTHLCGNRAPRLLYRGSLSLPDSNLLLDGLTFTTDLPPDDPQASLKLLESPLPLALESMRGRPSLTFIGVARMGDVFCDYGDGVNLHVHPRSILTHQLFSNHFCTDTCISGRTEVGIRIRLGETDSSDLTTTEIVVYGRPHPSTSTMQLCVARILPHPAPAMRLLPKAVAKLRPPRPDDPTPRKPPVMFGGGMVGGSKRTLDTGNGKEDPPSKKQKKGNHTGDVDAAKHSATKYRTGDMAVAGKSDLKIQDLGKNSRVGVFKLPELPPHAHKTLNKEPPQRVGDDVFLDDAKRAHETSVEVSNKLVVKRAAVRLLTAAGISKQHHEFKDFFGYVYRGTGFALRSRLTTTSFEKDSQSVDRVVDAHIKLYLNGEGGMS
ncbi:hypothetical protein BD410DRAFT_843189 [Rickenella mellea]|uniref:Sld7 C-terminal domain-containing protein n=1 Tax=Rickenella mellea TaxID=50990 RepID=A0A4Y7PU10_9AGAM|nr:hypothetical protein BD410DRAFT_843189 [Rickenella mellea]